MRIDRKIRRILLIRRQALGDALVTLDRQQLERGAALVTVRVP